MRFISLRGRYGKDRYILVSDSDFKKYSLVKVHLSQRGYAYYKLGKKSIYLHKEIMGNPNCVVDHKNGFPLDCRRSNLRLANKSTNGINSKKRKNAVTSNFKGVDKCKNKSINQYRCRVTTDKKPVHIGYFNSQIHAAIAYDLWTYDLFGDRAVLNLPIVISSGPDKHWED